MTRNLRRNQLAPAYILHHRPFRDTSRILEVLTRDDGRLTLFARGVRGPKLKLAALLQPFCPLLLSWSGRGEAAQLTGAEMGGDAAPLPAASVLAAFYLNELVLRLTTRHDPQPGLFEAYQTAIGSLRRGEPIAPVLRLFEKRLLTVVGYGLNLTADAASGLSIDPEAHYHFRPGAGLVPAASAAPGALSGRSLALLEEECLQGAAELEDARTLLQAALAHCLEGRSLATRSVARSMARRGSQK